MVVHNGGEGLVLTFWRDQAAIDAVEPHSSYRATVKQITEADLFADPQRTTMYQMHLIDVVDLMDR